jgi:predicted nucleic acid-binding protein
MASSDDPSQESADGWLRAFTDSSVLVAAALSESGAAYAVFDFAREGHIVLFASQYALDEAERNLYRKNPGGLRAFWELRNRLRLVDPSSELIAEVAQSVEPKDAAIVAGAVEANAHFLMTHDHRHLSVSTSRSGGTFEWRQLSHTSCSFS